MQYKGREKAAKVVEFVAKWLNLCLSTVYSKWQIPGFKISNFEHKLLHGKRRAKGEGLDLRSRRNVSSLSGGLSPKKPVVEFLHLFCAFKLVTSRLSYHKNEAMEDGANVSWVSTFLFQPLGSINIGD